MGSNLMAKVRNIIYEPGLESGVGERGARGRNILIFYFNSFIYSLDFFLQLVYFDDSKK